MSGIPSADLDAGAAAAFGLLERARLRLAGGAEVPPRAGAAVRSGDDADHVHAALHLRVRGGAGRVAAGVSAVLPAGDPGADGGLQRGLFRDGAVDGPREGAVRPVPDAADLAAGALRRADGGGRAAAPDRRG